VNEAGSALADCPAANWFAVELEDVAMVEADVSLDEEGSG
jgi:hypothetical protein